MEQDPLDIEKTIGREEKPGGFTLSTGQTLGQYQILRQLGRGGMGEVYLCEHAILTTRHAVKLLPAERSASPGFVQRFHDEARVMAKLSHPGIVHVTHADEQSGRHYLVMDFVGADGTEEPYNLEDALAGAPEGRLDPAQVARLCRQMAQAVGAAHKAGVVHRDLKPANVLLTSRDLSKAEARVADFGLARLLGEDWVRSRIDTSIRQSLSLGGMPTLARRREERSSSGAILGTYEYMSPEQREGREADERSDVFALGVMLYRMTTGKRLVGRAKAASKVVAGLDPAWDELIDACLEEDPADRPRGMGALAATLEQLEALERQRHEAARKAAQERKAREEAARQARAQDEARRLAEEIRQREEEQRRRDEECRAEQERQAAQKPSVPSRPKSSMGWVWVLVVLTVVGGVMWAAKRPVSTPAPKPVARPTPSRLAQPEPVRAPEPPSAPPSAVSAPKPTPSPARAEPLAGTVKTVDLGGGVALELAWIPAGSFTMGSPGSEADRNVDEGPQHEVLFAKGFWMGKTEVTQRQYQQVMRANPSKWLGYDLPVDNVSWSNAKEFCRKVGQILGAEMRLPSEAEWEYACRAGTTTPFHYGDSLDATMANFDGNYPYGSGKKGKYRHEATAVKSFRPNSWGLFDMHGNMWEWCEDWYHDNYIGAPSDGSPWLSPSGSRRVLRSGAWNDYARNCRSAFRAKVVPEDAHISIGFRVVLVAR